MCPLKLDLVFVTFDPETADIRSVIVTHPSVAITLQPSKLRLVYSCCINGGTNGLPVSIY